MPRHWWIASVACLALGIAHVNPQSTPLAVTPPMGWSTWNYFHHDISDALIRAQADAMVSSGMRDAGYVYVNIDGGWQGYRNAQGVLHPNRNFPDMKALGDYIHSKGLKFGMYSGPGPETCAGAPASYGHEEQDAKMFASWGVDFVKYDLCSFRAIMVSESGAEAAASLPLKAEFGYAGIMARQPGAVVEKADGIMEAAYEKMHQAILATGRPMVFSLCQYGFAKVWDWGPKVGGNMWRTSGDVSDNYDSVIENGFGEAGLAPNAGPGHWNDPDFLEVGNGNMTPDEWRTNFSLWAILAAPLIAGNDLAHMTPETRNILLNREIIAVDQDPLGKQGDRAYQTGPLQVWTRRLRGADLAVGLFNVTHSPAKITLNLNAVGWHGPVYARDLWAHRNMGQIHGEYTVMVPGHGVTMLRLSRREH
ncbi:MAG: glycoside hydrolase family 27 protein [Terracidiphilus sp.]